jgi:nucleotide-binding universal stress UspA family protein
MYSRILVPTDGSDITRKAVQTAISLARRLDAQLFAISVKEPFPYSAISEVHRRSFMTRRKRWRANG